ncbi:hypothetical protein A2U01_0086308, partial [Trifolium medium]|nr:hypothetical protein [Trifolium medium]
ATGAVVHGGGPAAHGVHGGDSVTSTAAELRR